MVLSRIIGVNKARLMGIANIPDKMVDGGQWQ